jgi:hypothetical protein
VSRTPSPIQAILRVQRAAGPAAYVPPVFTQVTEVCGLKTNTSLKEPTQSRDLQVWAGRSKKALRNRAPLVPGSPEALAKLSIETGRRHPKTGKPLPPLEPWTCPVKTSVLLYAGIVKGGDGADLVTAYEGEKRKVLDWLVGQELVAVDGDAVLPLSDTDFGPRRTYPGAPISDDEIKRTRSCYLGERGDGLVMAAWVNLRNAERTQVAATVTVDAPRDGELDLPVPARKLKRTANGVALTAYDLCAEVNRIIGTRPDLDGFRYMSVEVCRRIISGTKDQYRDGKRIRKGKPGLLERGMLTELQPPKAVRQNRTWRTLPRVFGLDAGFDEVEVAGSWGAGPCDRPERRHEATEDELALYGQARTWA